MGRFDVTARRAAKREPAGFFRWAMPRLDPGLAFAGWLDVRTVPPPPESELTCDALAEFAASARPEEPWIMVAEFQTEPRNDDLERCWEYALRFRRERRPSSDARLKYFVGGVLLNLTGPRQSDSLTMSMPGMPGFGLGSRVERMAVREEDAAATLARVASGELSRCVLPWVALMRGGGTSAVIEEWKRLADLEPDQRVRLEYAVDALIFAELPGVWTEWKKALEGWNVRESQQVLEWQAEARRADLLRVLEKRCKAPTPSDLVEMIQATQDMNLLLRWVDVAAEANTFDEFRAATQAQG
ncbi:MAG TPA: hypothetical protein VEL76_25035 [Gemmataceae bacterium]|nr:hypothetical protein [Gemmataceae bacterium]